MGEVGSNTKDGPVTLEQLNEKLDRIEALIRESEWAAKDRDVNSLALFVMAASLSFVALWYTTHSDTYALGGLLFIGLGFFLLLFGKALVKWQRKMEEV